nr:superaquaporin 2 [Haliotis discus hannai]
MNWRQLWAITVGHDPSVDFLHPLIAALLFYIIAYTACFTFYTISYQLFPNSLKIYILDFFKTLVICSYPYGHGLVRSFAGHVGYCAVAVPLVMLTLHTFKEGSPSPLSVFEDFLAKKLSLFKTLVRIVVQTAAGFASFRLVHLIWSLEFHPDHVKSMRAVGCDTDLKVSIFVGFLIEMMGVLYDTWLSYQPLFRFSLLDEAVKTLNGTILVCLGLHLTGMYMQPAMASGLSFGCKGTSAWEHVLVYWVGAFLGCYGAIVLNKYVHFSLVKGKDKSVTNGHRKGVKNGLHGKNTKLKRSN